MAFSKLSAHEMDIRNLIEPLDDETAKLQLMDDEMPEQQESLGAGRYGIVCKYKMSATGQFSGAILAGKMIGFKTHDRNMIEVQELKGILKKVIDEVKVHSKLDHKNILQFKAFRIETAQIVIFTELMEHSVKRLILENPLLPTTALNYTTQVAAGLEYLHDQRPVILHRDIKCDNILVCENGKRVKLADFGLVFILALGSASLSNLDTAPTSVAGTPNFMAPEVLRNGSTYGREADIWSLACATFEMLNCKPPLSDENREEYLRPVASYFPAKETMSELTALMKLLHCMFIVDPQNRPNATTVRKACKNVQRGDFSYLNHLFKELAPHMTTSAPLPRIEEVPKVEFSSKSEITAGTISQKLPPSNEYTPSTLMKCIAQIAERLDLYRSRALFAQPRAFKANRNIEI